MQVSGHGSNQVLLLILSGGYLLVAVKIASSIFVNQPNATKPKSSETQFKFQFELSLAQLSPSLLLGIMYRMQAICLDYFLPLEIIVIQIRRNEQFLCI